jgi:methyl coenzyme M reductase beta subunit
MSMKVVKNRIQIYDSNGKLIEEKEVNLEEFLNFLVSNVSIDITINFSNGTGTAKFKVNK